MKDVLSKTPVCELHVWHVSASWLILCSVLWPPITLTVFVAVPTQAFSRSFSSPGSRGWQQTGLFTLGSTPARLTPFYPGQSFKTSLVPLLALTCPRAMLRDTQLTPLSSCHKTPCCWSVAQSFQYLGHFELENEWKIMIVLCISWSPRVQRSCRLSCMNCEGGGSPVEKVPALSNAYVRLSSPVLLVRARFFVVSSQAL